MSLTNKIEAPSDGFHPSTRDTDYQQWDAVSVSRIKGFEKTPAHVWAYMTQPPKSTPALEMGIALHQAILQPQRFEKHYFEGPAGDGRTKAVKQEWAELYETHPGGTGLKPEDWATCTGARDAVWRHGYAADLLGGEGHNEASYVWTDPGTGLRCKARADRVTLAPDGYGAVVDLKSIAEADTRKIEYAIRDYAYHVQGAHYIDGLNELIPADRRFILIFVEKSPPFAARVVEVDLASMELGRRKRRKWLNLYRQCIDSGEWPGYEGMECLGVPEFEYKLEEADEEVE